MEHTEPQRAVTERVNEPTDGELLQRVASQRDQASFAVLVRRYGPLVLSVCRRVLRQEQDAEDAFQATFVVLFRKAGSISKRESVGSWLYSVAYRTARKAKVKRARRQGRETQLPDVPAGGSSPTWQEEEVRAVLDKEVNLLPAKYRLPFIFCYFEGKTNEQAAQLLGCALGTVQSRLARARARLRGRLTRRGLAIPAGLVALVLAEQAAWAEVPAFLVEATLQSATAFSAGQAGAASATSARVAELAQEVLREQSLAKLAHVAKVTAGSLAVAGLVALSVLLLWWVLRPRTDHEKLQGVWLATEFWSGLQRFEGPSYRMIFIGNQCNVRIQNVMYESTFRLDPTRDPKAIDFTMEGGRIMPGIYQLEDDHLLVVMNFFGQERPSHFKRGVHPLWSFWELRRE